MFKNVKIYFDRKKGLCIERLNADKGGKKNNPINFTIFGWIMLIEIIVLIVLWEFFGW
jgi:hypothetical protein